VTISLNGGNQGLMPEREKSARVSGSQTENPSRRSRSGPRRLVVGGARYDGARATPLMRVCNVTRHW